MKRMMNIAFTTAVVALSLLSVKGCIFSPKTDDPVKQQEYVPQTSPEAVVENLQIAYRLKEIEGYAKLLAQDFIFKFQPIDAAEIETDFWTHDQDSVGTEALFTTDEVSTIRISLLHGPAIPANEVGLPPETLKIRINQVSLEVDQTDGITWLVQDIQDMFFLPGQEAAGEDTTKWYLAEWRDIPSTAAPRPGTDPLSEQYTAPNVRQTTWGEMLSVLRQETP